MTLHIYIGDDPREVQSIQACVGSLKKRIKKAIFYYPIHEGTMRSFGWYWRRWYYNEKGHQLDTLDGKPFTTDFAFTRFLIPWIHERHYLGDRSTDSGEAEKKRGWAIFCDSDFLFREDPNKLLELADDRFAVMCVKHKHFPPETEKKSGLPQTRYHRKNWSSLMMWNLDHPANKKLTLEDVNTQPGAWLHSMGWLRDEEIGDLPEGWNWLEGWSDESIDPNVVHYTRGVPTHVGMADAPYADEWWNCLNGYWQSRDSLSGYRGSAHGCGESQVIEPRDGQESIYRTPGSHNLV